jgi:hypothetical protein
MSGFLPANTTLQLGTNSGSINHQGNLTSNINGTPLIGETFPTTSTGTSTCHAHYTDSDTKALKFLNSSATSVGGHEFWVSTSSSAPIKTFDVNKDRAIIDTSLRNTTNKTILDTTNNTLTFYDSLGTSYTIMYPSSYQITNEPESIGLGFTNNNMYVLSTDSNNNVATRIYAGLFQNTDLTLGNQSLLSTTYLDINKLNTIQKSILTSENLSITDLSSNVSVLSPTDLTFNNVSLPTRVSTAESDIDTLTIKQTNLIYQFASPAIYADARPMIATPTTVINTYAVNAWYFKNTFASNNKINWYMPPNNGMLVSDILGLYLRFLNLSTTSNDNTMFLVVYTKLQASGNYASWYHSSITYTLDSSIQPTINTNYTMFMNVSGSCPNPSYYASSLVDMQISSVSPNPRGTYDPTDEILAFSISTNSASPINSVEFVLQKFGIMTPNGTQEFQFAPLI